MSSAASRMFKAIRGVIGQKKPRSERFQSEKVEVTETKEITPPSQTSTIPPKTHSDPAQTVSPTPVVMDHTQSHQGGDRKVQFKTVKPHIPMIKFRKGSLMPKISLPETTLAPAAAPAPAKSSQAKEFQPTSVNLEWWQTPLKFKRRDVGDLEMDAINSGGADKLYH